MVCNIFELLPTAEGNTILNRIIYDITQGYIVIASDEETARNLVNNRGDEGIDFWRNNNTSTCVAIGEAFDDVPRVVMRNYIAG